MLFKKGNKNIPRVILYLPQLPLDKQCVPVCMFHFLLSVQRNLPTNWKLTRKISIKFNYWESLNICHRIVIMIIYSKIFRSRSNGKILCRVVCWKTILFKSPYTILPHPLFCCYIFIVIIVLVAVSTYIEWKMMMTYFVWIWNIL